MIDRLRLVTSRSLQKRPLVSSPEPELDIKQRIKDEDKDKNKQRAAAECEQQIQSEHRQHTNYTNHEYEAEPERRSGLDRSSLLTLAVTHGPANGCEDLPAPGRYTFLPMRLSQSPAPHPVPPIDLKSMQN